MALFCVATYFYQESGKRVCTKWLCNSLRENLCTVWIFSQRVNKSVFTKNLKLEQKVRTPRLVTTIYFAKTLSLFKLSAQSILCKNLYYKIWVNSFYRLFTKTLWQLGHMSWKFTLKIVFIDNLHNRNYLVIIKIVYFAIKMQ
jgi:hypothetical protein